MFGNTVAIMRYCSFLSQVSGSVLSETAYNRHICQHPAFLLCPSFH
uniref:Uncharacterized protein n=1 Tax=Anguilla anguilla TaxID=7936 RepID=A0A0E9RAT3_ANGAN